MVRNISKMPALFRRSENGNYYFRRTVGTRRITINTGTANHVEAKKFLQNYLSCENASAIMVKHAPNVSQIANAFALAAVGKDLERTPLAAAFDIWKEHTPAYYANSERYRKMLQVYFLRFMEWCRNKNVIYLEEVNHSVAMRYHAYLYRQKFASGTLKKQIRLISRVLRTVATVKNIPWCDSFAIYKNQITVAANDTTTHLPLEPEMITAVMQEAINTGEIWSDLFVVALQTGMRLKDAALLRWDMIDGDFIEFYPEKTIKHGNKARLPISPLLRQWLASRRRTKSPYVNPEIAKMYKNGGFVSQRTKNIFERALGKNATVQSKSGMQRQRSGCIRSFHSFRVTFMSLLAAKQVPIADAMTMLGWESIEMVKLYTKMLEKAKGDMDFRNFKVLNQMQELNITLPSAEVKLIPTPKALVSLMPMYSNIAIGKIYGISDSAIHKWQRKFGLFRSKRVESPEITAAEIANIRNHLLQKTK